MLPYRRSEIGEIGRYVDVQIVDYYLLISRIFGRPSVNFLGLLRSQRGVLFLHPGQGLWGANSSILWPVRHVQPFSLSPRLSPRGITTLGRSTASEQHEQEVKVCCVLLCSLPA